MITNRERKCATTENSKWGLLRGWQWDTSESAAESKSPSRLRIGLLAIGGSHWIAGVNYVVNLSRGLAALPVEERPEIYLVEQPYTDLNHYDRIRPLVRIVPWPRNGAGHLWRRLRSRGKSAGQAEFQARKIKGARIDCIFPCKFTEGLGYGIPWLGWAVDFQHKYFPEFFDPAQVEDREKAFRFHADRAALVVASSLCAAEDFRMSYPWAAERVRVLNFRTVPERTWFDGNVDEIRAKFRLPEKYLMTPNQFFVHKNHRYVMEAIKGLRDRGMDAHLVCTGHTEDFRRPAYFGELTSFIDSAGLGPYVHILGLLPRFEQIQLMRGAAAIVQPSLFEGWSTVVEDARALGKTVFLSDIPVHREQDPPRAIYFDPNDPESLASKIAGLWDCLGSGPVLHEERAARTAQAELVTRYAREFMAMARELTEMSGNTLRLGNHGTW